MAEASSVAGLCDMMEGVTEGCVEEGGLRLSFLRSLWTGGHLGGVSALSGGLLYSM